MAILPDDTIAALASPAGPGARGIVRLSGPACRTILDGLFDPSDPASWQSARVATRHAGRLHLHATSPGSHEAGGEQTTGRPPSSAIRPQRHIHRRADAALPGDVYLWPTRRSFTGQPAAEIHTVGSPPLLEAVLSALHDRGARPARPGEFTLRAFLAGRIDLVQAEAVLGVIDAHDHQELELALRQLSGGLSGRMAAVRGDLLNLLADLEAGLDFVEEDIEFVGRDEVVTRLTAAQDTVAALLEQATARMQSTGRRLVVLAGPPNAGKSTLFNALVGREAALVSEIRGTTRDYLVAELDWNGTAVELVDTAGWEHGGAGLVPQAQALRGVQLERADLILFCLPADADGAASAEEFRVRQELGVTADRLMAVQTKSDLAIEPLAPPGEPGVCVSGLTHAGLRNLIEAAAAHLAGSRSGDRQLLGMTAARSRESLAAAHSALERARDTAATGAGDELVALEARSALDGLSRVCGAVYTDDVLDRVFSRFCIGK